MNKLNSKTGVLTILGIGIIGVGAICVAQSINKNIPQSDEPTTRLSIDEQIKLAKAAREERIREKWTGDEKPFLDIQREMDEAIAQGQSAKTLASDAKAAAVQSPQDAQAQFRWAYAALKAVPSISEKEDDARGLHGIAQAMWKAESPRSYQYDRLLFLIETFFVTARELRPLGERLLDHNPNDLKVIARFVWMLKIGQEPQETQRALKYTQQLIKSEPNNPRYLAMLGDVYYWTTTGTRRRSDADKTVAAYQRYLKVAPADDSYRSNAKDSILIMQKFRHLWKGD